MSKCLVSFVVLIVVVYATGVCWARPEPIPKIAVTTYHYDNFRIGWNSHEYVLTPTLKIALVSFAPLKNLVFWQKLCWTIPCMHNRSFFRKSISPWGLTVANTM